MLNYLNNNIILINEYQELYKNGIDINSVIEKFKTEELVTHNAFAYGRFRVFIDSCMLLLNKEKLNYYYKNKYCYKEFLDKINRDDELKPYLEYYKKERISVDIDGTYLFYSLEGIEKNTWNQVDTIRKAMAHMQYGNFCQQENGRMLYYFLYNKDKGVRKDAGIVFEPLLHKFVHVFFSNYSYGILFKNTFFSRYSFEKREITRNLYFYEITCKKEKMEIYNGYNANLMSEFAQISHEGQNVFVFLEEHKEKLNIKERQVKDIISIRKYNKLAKKYRLNSYEKYIYGLKTLLDLETELSNFFVHISHLNEALYEYCCIHDCVQVNVSTVEKYKQQLEKEILELKEDESANLAFDLGFTYLKAMNFALRTEDDDYEKLKYGDVNVSMFEYNKNSFKKYVRDTNIDENRLQHYIIARMRNALMHGHIQTVINRKGQVVLIFLDNYNKRTDSIEICLEKLKIFLSQDCLYNGVPKTTPVFIGKRV